jgi:hypothetical protein|tara:strand:+ start:221 stop:502 length:282 start_codon:yes stop_codon:yes gene_type:complete
MMELIQIILPTSIILILIYVVWNLIRKVEKLEDELDTQDEFLGGIDTKFNDALKRMQEIDRVGSFEADDESGYIFEKIKEVIEELKNEYTNRP